MFVKRIGPYQILSVAPDVMKRSMVAQCAHIGFHTQCGIRLPTPEPTYDQITSVLTECDIRSSATSVNQILSVPPDVMKRSMVAQCAHIGFHTQCGIRLPTPEPTYDQAQITSVLTECDIRSSATSVNVR